MNLLPRENYFVKPIFLTVVKKYLSAMIDSNFLRMVFRTDGYIDCQNATRGYVFRIPAYISRHIKIYRLAHAQEHLLAIYRFGKRDTQYFTAPFFTREEKASELSSLLSLFCALFGTFKVDVGNFFAFRMLTH